MIARPTVLKRHLRPSEKQSKSLSASLRIRVLTKNLILSFPPISFHQYNLSQVNWPLKKYLHRLHLKGRKLMPKLLQVSLSHRAPVIKRTQCSPRPLKSRNRRDQRALLENKAKVLSKMLNRMPSKNQKRIKAQKRLKPKSLLPNHPLLSKRLIHPS